MSLSPIDPEPPNKSLIHPGINLGPSPEPLGGKLLLEESVTYGQHGELYKGVWALSDHDYKPVALKCIRLRGLADDLGYDHNRMYGLERTFKRIVKETSIWVSLKHPNILPFYGYQTRDEELILVSRWGEKQSLDRFLALYPEFTIIDKLELLHEAACGLEYLHSLQPPIAHGGIQPKNVIITDELHATLSDVALSRVMTNLGVRSGLTTGGQAVEFAGYHAIELLLEESLPTLMSDAYAFGGLILSTLSGKAPFWKKSTSAAVVIAIAHGSIPQPKDHPQLHDCDDIWETLRACWNAGPEKRPTMTTVRKELEAYISKYEKSWGSTSPKRARDKIPVTEGDTTTVGNSGSIPRLLPTTDFLRSAPPEESPFKSGAPIRDIMPQYKLEGTLVKIEQVGSGGYGDVFQGVWKRSNDEVVLVAIKSIRGNVTSEKSGDVNQEQSDFMIRIIRETTIWKVAQHPNILSFYGYQIVGGEAMLVSPWCKNGSLDSYIDKHKNLSEGEKLKLLSGAARGLAYLHSRNPPIAHGDIKPQNVIITDKVEAALCDFGIARVMCDFTTGVTSRNPGAGTTRYQAKELLLDSAQPTNMSDLYAFGGLILATMSGKPPFHQHKTTTSVILAITQDQTPRPADHLELDEKDPLWNLLRECWKTDPKKRPTVKQVSRMLEGQIRRRSRLRAGPTTS